MYSVSKIWVDCPMRFTLRTSPPLVLISRSIRVTSIIFIILYFIHIYQYTAGRQGYIGHEDTAI